MLDTVKLRSPHISEVCARRVEAFMQRRTCLDLATGELLWEFTMGQLEGSYDHRVSLRVERKDWVKLPGERQPRLVPCMPFLVLEGSVHKALLGHNVFGGPLDLAAACCWLVDRLAALVGVELPVGASWLFRRLDWAEVYDLGDFNAVQEWMGYLRHAEFPRRKVARYAFDGLSVAGSTTTVKAYHKGPEFQRHDRLRLRGHLDVDALQQRANLLLRCEVEIHARTLDDEYCARPAVNKVTVQWVKELHDRDMGRLLHEGRIAMRTVRTGTAVRRRLQDLYTPARARALYGTWLQLSAYGEDFARASLSARSFYRHRAELKAAACSWHNGDVVLDTTARLVPEDFAPVRSDPRRLVVEAPEVAAALEVYRRSA